MKKNLMILGASALILAAFSFNYKAKATSLNDLRAKAASYCSPNSSTDCESSATGNIYIGYEGVN
jgi:hypothetical protein